MGLLDKARQLFPAPVATYGTDTGAPARRGTWSTALPTAVTGYGQRTAAPASVPVAGPFPSDDQTAVERYRYLLRTSPPEQVEQVHAEAFAELTPAQRREVLRGLAPEVPVSERIAAADDPRSLARMATRAEMRQPGTLERVFGGTGTSAGGAVAGGLLAGVAAAVVGSVLVDGLLDTGFGDSGSFGTGANDGLLGFGGPDGDFDS